MIGARVSWCILRDGSQRRRQPMLYRPVVQNLEDRNLLSFLAPINYPADGNPVVAGDFTGHGHLDLALLTASVRILPGNGDGTFQPELPPVVVGGPNIAGWAAADLTGNGILDLVLTHDDETSASHTLSVLLGNGDGTFRAPLTFDAGPNPHGVAIGDLNGDGIPDIVVTNYGFFFHDQFQPGTTVTVLLGNGDGTFQAPRTFDTGITPESVAVGDFTGDGRLSIVTADDGDVGFLKGNGDGTFQEPVFLSLGTPGLARSLAVADLNGDGRLDIVTANDTNDGGTVSVLLGRGNGTFQNTLTFPVSNNAGFLPTRVALGDFSGDGGLDVAVTGFLGGLPQVGLYVLPGNGDGTFQASSAIRIQQGDNPVVGDFNGDGIDDLAVSTGSGLFGASVSILLGQPGRSLNFPSAFTAGAGATSLQTADLNGNGFSDLVTANAQDNTVSVLLANGDGTFQPPAAYAVGQHPQSAVVADLTGNGTPDLVVLNEGDRTVSVLLGNGDGTFQPAQTIALTIDPSFVPVRLALGDFTGGGHLDLAVLQATQGGGPSAVLVLRGHGDGTFSQDLTDQTFGINIFDPFLGNYIFQAAALTSSGTLDLVVGMAAEGNRVAVLRGNGDGTFRQPQFLTLPDPPRSVTVGDLTGTGIADLVITTQTSSSPPLRNTVYVLMGNGDGTFQPPVGYDVGGSSFAAVIGDFDSDGVPDIAAVTNDTTLSILHGNGDGTFGARSSYLVPSAIGLVAGDFNGDGAPDLALTSRFANDVTVVLNANDGTAPGRGAARLPHQSAQRAHHALPAASLGQALLHTPATPRLETTAAPASAPPGRSADAYFAALATGDHDAVIPRRLEGRIPLQALHRFANQDGVLAVPTAGLPAVGNPVEVP